MKKKEKRYEKKEEQTNEETNNNEETEKTNYKNNQPAKSVTLYTCTRFLLLPERKKNIRPYSHYKIYKRESRSIQKKREK
jgi:hypothetical protein